MSVAYLSSPYFDPDPAVKERRHATVNQIAFDLMSQGIMVYSPHRLGGMTWEDFDHTMLSRCDRVIVLKLPGWESSKGVAAEIACAEKLGIPIEWMDIEYKYTAAASPYKDILERLQVLNSERDWEQFHSPKNLAMNLGVETGELMEHFRWMTESQSFAPQKLEGIRYEIGDVFLNLLNLSHVLGIELNQAAHDKITEISKKYPVEQSKGIINKYTEFNT